MKPTNANARGVRIYGATLATMLLVAATGIVSSLALHPHHIKPVTRKVVAKSHALPEWNPIAKMRQRLLSRSNHDTRLSFSPWHKVKLTWYSFQGGWRDGTITRSGTHVQDDWTIAVDSRVIPLGSLVQIRFRDGTIHTYRAVDTGGAIKGARIDIFDSNRRECIENGVQIGEYRIVDRGA